MIAALFQASETWACAGTTEATVATTKTAITFLLISLRTNFCHHPKIAILFMFPLPIANRKMEPLAALNVAELRSLVIDRVAHTTQVAVFAL
jgi:hypothetical protein